MLWCPDCDSLFANPDAYDAHLRKPGEPCIPPAQTGLLVPTFDGWDFNPAALPHAGTGDGP